MRWKLASQRFSESANKNGGRWYNFFCYPATLLPFYRSWLIFILYTFLALILTYPLALNVATAVPIDIGDPLLNTWILAWDTHALLTDPLNLFNANIFYPLPNTLAYSEHLFSTALLAQPLQLFSGEPVAAYNFSLLLSFPLAGFGMYLLALRWTHHRGAAFIAGLIFAFNPYRFAAMAHLQLLTFQWLPYAVLGIDLLLRGGAGVRCQVSNARLQVPGWWSFSNVALLLVVEIFVWLQILASWYLALYAALILGVYLLAVLISRRFQISRLAPVFVTLLLAALLTLPFILPYLPLLDDLRQSRPVSLALSLAASPTDFLAAAPLNFIFGPLTEQVRARPGFIGENTLFVGGVVVVLAVIGIGCQVPGVRCQVSGVRSLRFVAFAMVVVAVLSLLLTFPAPYALLAALFPPSTIVRVPPRWIIPALFALSILAALGYSHLSHFARHAPRLTSYVLFLFISTLLILETLSIPLPLAPVNNQQTLNPAYHWLDARPGPLALVELPMHSAPAPEYPEVKRMAASTLGWWQLVNGYSGYTPPRQPQLAQTLAGFPDETSITALQTLIPSSSSSFFILVHPGEAPLDRTQWETVDRWRAERNPALYPVGVFEDDYLYQLLPEGSQKFAVPVATFGPNQTIRLLAANLELPDSASVSPARLLLYWQTEASLSADLIVFIHLRAADGFVRTQADGPPVRGHSSTVEWSPGEIVQDIHPLPPEDFTQVDHLAVGLYDPITGKRLPAFGPAGEPLPDDAVVINLRGSNLQSK